MIHQAKRKITQFQEEVIVQYLVKKTIRDLSTRRKLVHFIEYCQKDEHCLMDPPPPGWQKWGDSALRVVAATYMREGYDRARLKAVISPQNLMAIFENAEA